MSTYVKEDKALEFDNAPDWLIACMRYRRTMLGNTPKTVMTDFISLREYFQWLYLYKSGKRMPRKHTERLREVNLLDMPLDMAIGASRSDIEAYLFYCADTLNNGERTRKKKLAAIRGFYGYILDQSEVLHTGLEFNPAERVKSPKAPKKQPIFLPEAERTSLLDAVSGENAVRDYAMLLLMATCGLRVSEVVNIEMRDVNFEARTILIHGKGNKERAAFPTEACIKAMQRYLKEYRNPVISGNEPGAPFFVSKRTGGKITTRSVERMMQKHVNAAGIGGMGYTPHKLRHTTATILAKDGVDLLAIQHILGHESPSTTQIYTHLGQDDLSRAIAGSSLSNLGDDK